MDSAARKNRERRSAPRVPVGVRVQVRAGAEQVAADLMNISLDGMFLRPSFTAMSDTLRIAALLGPDASLLLRLRLTGQAGTFEARGRVAWKSDLGVGIDFSQLSAPLSDFIQRLVDAGADSAVLVQAIEPDPVVDVL